MWGPLGEFSPRGSEGALASIAQPWVFEKLVTVDDRGELKPALAARIGRLAGGAMRVELRGDAIFSDGTPVTEDDVVRSLESNGLRVVRQQEASLIVESRQPGAPVDALLLQANVFRQSGGQSLGSGPFVVASASDKELRLVRRRPEAGRVDEVQMVGYSTPRDAFSHTLKGDANAIVDLESRWLDFFQDVPRLQVVRGQGHGTDAIVFNSRLPQNERLRLARVLASPRVRELAYRSGECAEERETGSDALPPPGEPLRILTWGPLERLGLAARRGLGTRGGDVVHVGPGEVLARLKTRDFDLVALRPLRWPASFIALLWGTRSPENPSGYSNASVDRAIAVGDWAAAEAALVEDPPAAFVCTRSQLAVVDARIRNPKLGPYDLLETLPEWEVAQ